MFSPQWYAEITWWSKFLVAFTLWYDLDPIPLDLLKNKHSELKVVEYWVHNDSTAVERFIHDAHVKRKHDDLILVLRNAWANNTDTKLRELNTIDNMRKYLDTSKTYRAFVVPKHEHYYLEDMTLDRMLNEMNDTSEKLTTLSFDYTILEDQPWLWQQYLSMWENLGTNFLEVLDNFGQYKSHAFLYYGNKWRTRLHNGASMDYFLQIANSKRWRFVHKRYIPYLNMYRFGHHAALRTPEYYSDDYPSGSIPRTEVVVNPGDVMWFASWHVHEVLNDHPDQLGFAIGIRPNDNVKRIFNEPMRALLVYNWLLLPNVLYHGLMMVGSYDRQVGHWSDECASQNGRRIAFSYDGTSINRYDMGLVNGTCEFRERSANYQEEEILGKLKVTDWSPKVMQ